MNVLHVNNTDLIGKRFNGFDLIAGLEDRGIHCSQAVLDKQSDSDAVFSLLGGRADYVLRSAVDHLERQNDICSVLQPWGRVLSQSEAFRSADVVHYHLIHNGLVSLLDLPWLTALKPSIWTFHDPWPLTGHCLYPPRGCDGWSSDCAACPYPDEPYELSCAGAAKMWQVKRAVYEQLDVDIVVASEYMRDMVRRSPLGGCFPQVHLIPFASPDYIAPMNAEECRRELGLSSDSFVILVRATTLEKKGFSQFLDALRLAPPARPMTILTVDQEGLVPELGPGYQVQEHGWVGDQFYNRLLSACDVLVMPSVSEAFGLMAIEAMSVGRAVICYEGTSLPSVTHAPECGIAVPNSDVGHLREAIDWAAANPEDVRRRGELGREIVKKEYGEERYLGQLADLYGAVVERHKLDSSLAATRTTICD